MAARNSRKPPKTKPGWYWYRAGDDSPENMRRGIWVVVLVGTQKATRDGKPGPLVVRFSHGTYTVEELGGEWEKANPPKD